MACDSHLLSTWPCFRDDLYEGLVIDDYFAVSVDDIGAANQETISAKAYEASQVAYRESGLVGSSEKDIRAEKEGKAIGAFLNGSDRATLRGVCLVSAAPEKRLALSALTLELCALPYTTVVGAWVSVLLYRRPMMSLLNESFQLVSQFSECNEAALIPLPRAVACELVLVSVLAPVEVSDIAVPYDPVLYATDASEDRGAIVHTEVGEDLVRLLSKVCKTKGAYTRLQSPWERLMQKVGLHDELPDELQSVAADRPLAYTFEFVEIFAGSSRVTAALQQLGIVCGPPIDLSKAEEYNMSHVFVLSWLYHLVERGTLRAFMLEPPCTTFSIMRRPALRDIDQPYGFDPRDPQTRDGNILACRSLQLMHKAAVRRVSGIMERPFTAKTKAPTTLQSSSTEASSVGS